MKLKQGFYVVLTFSPVFNYNKLALWMTTCRTFRASLLLQLSRWLTATSRRSTPRPTPPPGGPSRRPGSTRSSSSSASTGWGTRGKCGGWSTPWPRSGRPPGSCSPWRRRTPGGCSRVTLSSGGWSGSASWTRARWSWTTSSGWRWRTSWRGACRPRWGRKCSIHHLTILFYKVFKLGLAKSIHHARVLIRQRHIRVRKQVVNIPSFIVRLDSQKHIDFSLKSPFGGGRWEREKDCKCLSDPCVTFQSRTCQEEECQEGRRWWWRRWLRGRVSCTGILMLPVSIIVHLLVQ